MTAGDLPRVLVDATSVPADRGGVGRYVDGLLGALSRWVSPADEADAPGGAVADHTAVVGAPPDHVRTDPSGAAGAPAAEGGTGRIELVLAVLRTDVERYSRLLPGVTVVGAPAAVAHRPARLAWEQTGLPLLAQQVGADIVHSPFYTCPLRASSPVTVTVHDATFFTEPEHYDKSRRTFFRSAIRSSLRRASRVVVPSKATRDELVRLLDADPTRVDVAYHGVDHHAFHRPSEEETARVRARLGLGEQPYIAFLGAKEPRKNVPNLVRGWMRAAQDRPHPPALVIAGGQGHDDAIDQAVSEVPSHLRVLRPGYLRYADLPGFLGGALVAAYPSYGEGFGLPILEAMACGTPVLTTPRLSLPEVGGDAVAYTSEDPEEIAADLESLLDDEPRRLALAKAGFDRAKEFTWVSSAEVHLQTWERIAGA